MQKQEYRKGSYRGLALWLIATALLTSASAQVARNGKPEPLMIQEQGSFAIGGKVITNPGTFNPKQPTPDGQTLHGDHAYVFYQIPVNRRKLPLVFLHGDFTGGGSVIQVSCVKFGPWVASVSASDRRQISTPAGPVLRK